MPVSRRNKWGQFGENLGRVKVPWSGPASRRLMNSFGLGDIPAKRRRGDEWMYIFDAVFTAVAALAFWPYIWSIPGTHILLVA
jgi:hypothetical protein